MTTTADAPKNPLLTKRGLPKHCPSWCLGEHKVALDEGCSIEDARVHTSEDLTGLLPDLQNYLAKRIDRFGNGGWDLRLIQEVADDGHGCTVAVRLQVHTHVGGEEKFRYQTLNLTTSEARTMAAQLLYFADAEELYRYDNR